MNTLSLPRTLVQRLVPGVLVGICGLIGSARAGALTGWPFALVGAPGGGGRSAGGDFVVNGWVTTAGAGTSSGDEFDLTCGLGSAYVPDNQPRIQAELLDDGRVRLWWPSDLVGYELVWSPAVSGPAAAWQPVNPAPAGNNYVIEATAPGAFYRLRRP